MYHCYPAGLRAFLRTNYRYGRGATIFRRLTSFSPKGRGYQPASFYTGLITYPFGRVRGWKALAASALLAASQAATALGAARQALARSTVKAPPKDATGFVDRLKLFGGLLTGEKAGTGPFFVTVDVTRRCNLTCIACYCHSPLREARPRDGGEDLAPETFASLLPQLKEMGTRGIVLSGDGEPLLHPRLPELISLAKDAGFHVMLFSNGTLLDRALIGKLIDSGLDALRVSMWAATREDFAGSYPGVNISYFDRMVEGITWMAREKAVRRSATPLLQIHHPIGRGAVRNLGALVDLAVHTRCDGVSFSPMKTAKGEFAERGLTPEMEAEAITTLKREKGRLEAAGLKHNIDETIMRYRLGEAVWKHAPCYVGWLHTRVKVNGTVQPCNRCPVAMGDLSQETFRAIWNGSRYRDFRREWLRAEPGAPPPETCDCGYCCYLRDHLRVHRVFRWFLPFLRSRAAGTDASRRDSC
jgi:MoaA/NifB/PqqE/SkfB family radical SAM enzyme